MADPITQEPGTQAPAPRPPIDLARIMGTPTPKSATDTPDHSWLDAPISAPEAEMQEKPSWWKEAALAIPRGVANTYASTSNLIDTTMNAMGRWDRPGGPAEPEFQRDLSMDPHPLGTSENVGPGLLEGVSQFAAGWLAGGAVLKAVGVSANLITGTGALAATGRAALGGSATTFVAFDGHSGRFADLVARIPGLEGPMQEYMGFALTSEDDSEIVGRLKNTIEGAGLGVATHYIIIGARGIRAGRRARAAGATPEQVAAAVEQAAPAAEAEKWLARMGDMRTVEESPFKGALLDDAMLKAKSEPVFVNVDGSMAVGFERKMEVQSVSVPIRVRAEVEADLAKNFDDAIDVLKRRLGFDDKAAATYLDNVRKMADPSNPEQAAAKAQVFGVLDRLKKRDRARLETGTPTGKPTSVLLAELRASGTERGVREAKSLGITQVEQPFGAPRYVALAKFKSSGDFPVTGEVKSWVNQHGTLLDNPQTVVNINPDGTASIGVSLSKDQWTPTAQKLAASIAPDMTPAQLGEAAQGLTKPKQPSPPNPEVPPPPAKPLAADAGTPDMPGAPGTVSEAAPPPPPKRTPHQIYLGEIGYDDKTADEIAELLQGEFVEGVAERGEINLKFKATGDAVNPKHMSRAELFHRGLREKGLNLEGLKGQPEVLAQAMRTLEKMHIALREAENPLLVKETFAEMNARVLVETDIINGIPTAHDKVSYIKLAEAAGVDAANKVGAQAKAGTDIASGIALDLHAKSVDFAKRKKANQPIQPWEYAVWAENRGLAKAALDMSVNLKNALGRNLYAQRGEIKPAKGALSHMTAVQIQGDAAALERILMDNGGLGKIADDAAKIATSGGRDLYGIAETLQLARASHGLLGMTIETGYAGMMSGMGTPISQLSGNMGVASWLPFRRGFSAAIHIPFTRNPETVAALKGEVAEAIGTYNAMFKLIPEALRGYKTGFLQGATLDPKGGVFDVNSRARRQQITGRNASQVAARFGIPMDPDGAIGHLIDGIGAIVSGPGRALQGGDEMVKVLMYRAVADAKLTRQHLLGLEGLTATSGKELGAAVAQDMDRLIYKGQALSLDQLERRALDHVQREGYTGIHAAERKNRLIAEWQKSDWYKRLSSLSDFAKADGAEAAMSTPLDPRTLGGGIQQILNRHPVLGFAISPFHKTSVNIAKFGLQHFDFISYTRWIAESKIAKKPGAVQDTTSRFLADMRSGDPIRQANARGRLVLGSTFASGVAALYMSGTVVGRGPADKNLRKRMMDDGWLPYSFHVNGKYYSYKRLEPLATLIGLVADVSQSFEEVPDDRLPDTMEIATGIGVALAANLTNKSYARGIADFTQAITSPAEYLEDWVRSIETRFVPNVLRDVSTVVDDPTLKQIRTTHDAMIAKVPWMSDALEPRRNVLGEPIPRSKKLGEDVFGPLIAPFSIVQVGQGSDALKSELAGVEHGLSIPSSKRGGYDMFDIKAANGQSSYDRWLENSSTIKLGGKTLRQALEQEIASPVYQAMSTENLNGQPSPRANRLQTIIDRHRRAAMLQTQREIKELNQAEMASRLARARR